MIDFDETLKLSPQNPPTSQHNPLPANLNHYANRHILTSRQLDTATNRVSETITVETTIRVLLPELQFEGKRYKPIVFSVNRTFWSDGASIPRWAWTLVGHPFYGKTLIPALVHDFNYVWNPHRYSRKHVDKLFEKMLIQAGHSKVTAHAMYLAVRLAGGNYWDKMEKQNHHKAKVKAA